MKNQNGCILTTKNDWIDEKSSLWAGSDNIPAEILKFSVTVLTPLVNWIEFHQLLKHFYVENKPGSDQTVLVVTTSTH
jgi:hypothetical protein